MKLLKAGIHAISECIEHASGYVYFKVWVLPDGQKWYKVGISVNPSRRDAEQNVLPVPAETIKIIRLPSIDYARSVESAFHQILDKKNILGANNKELFRLEPSEAVAISAVLQKLEEAALFWEV